MKRSWSLKTPLGYINYVGINVSVWRDLYHKTLRLSWPAFLSLMVLIYIWFNLIFAFAYRWSGAAISNVQPDYFWDYFSFSVQTSATIGYGFFAPVSPAAHVIVLLEAIVSLLYTGLTTGLIFTKFARASARISFCHHPIWTTYEGQPALMLRLANGRANMIMQATIKIILLKTFVTQEGLTLRRQLDLKLVRDNSAIFALPWTVIHMIDQDSPLYQMSCESFQATDAVFVVAVSGTDETFSHPVHAVKTYESKDIRSAKSFVDMVEMTAAKVRRVHYERLHDVIT